MFAVSFMRVIVDVILAITRGCVPGLSRSVKGTPWDETFSMLSILKISLI